MRYPHITETLAALRAEHDAAMGVWVLTGNPKSHADKDDFTEKFYRAKAAMHAAQTGATDFHPAAPGKRLPSLEECFLKVGEFTSKIRANF
jgi:hypothetical protein